MDDNILKKTPGRLCLYFMVFLEEICGGRTLSFLGLPGTGNVTENSPAGTVVYTFSVSLSPHLLPNISVLMGFPIIMNSNPLTQAFRINPETASTYKVVTTGNPILDYETMPKRFELQIVVFDTAGASDLQILTIQVFDEDEPPEFQENMANRTLMIYILENGTAEPIYQVHATGAVNYSLTPETLPFSVSETGTIYSKKSFDYEKDPPWYEFNITVTSHLGLSASRIVMVYIININDEAPYFTMKQRIFTVLEESRPGFVVANVTAADPDDTGYITSLRYSISNPEGIPYFYINPVTGVILVARRIDRDTATFQEHPNVTLIIHVEDSPGGGQSSFMNIVITVEDINDNPPTCDQYSYSLPILETAPPGSSIISLQIFCRDQDAEMPNKQFNFTGLSGFGSNQFTQDPPGSGNIKLIGNMDLENPTDGGGREEYVLTTMVQNTAPPYYSNVIYIYIKIQPVNEFVPVFSSPSYIFNVSEVESVGYQFGKVAATDKDKPFTRISYSIVSGGGMHSLPEIFWIDSTSGQLHIIAKLDYETKPSFILTVQASDTENTATAKVTVNVLEANDEPPICLPNSRLLNIPVDLSYGTNIAGFYIVCVDRDSSPTSFRYSINSGDVNNHFTFSPKAGSNVSRLMLASPFDYEDGLDTIWTYHLKVFITDDNLLSDRDRLIALIQTGTVTLTIKVIPKPTTVVPTTPGFTLVTNRENVYSPLAWYVPFLICFGILLLLGILGYLTFLLAKYIRTYCQSKPKADRKPLLKVPEKKKTKKEVVWEMTNLNPIFDGEALDPVTGRVYEYNSKSGARRWKDTNAPSKLEAKDPVVQAAGAANIDQINQSQQKAEISGGKLGEKHNKNQKADEKKAGGEKNSLKLQKPNEDSLGKTSASPLPPRKSPAPSPKIYPKI